jgi:inosine/xanthosine triphosphatase
MTLRVAVASQRAPKLEAVRAALGRIAAVGVDGWSPFVVTAHATASGVDATPRHDVELQRGARQRAVSLQRRLEAEADPARIYLGLEGGIHADENGAVWLRSWAFAWDGRRGAFGCGPSAELPPVVAGPVLRGEDLAAVIDRVAGAEDVRSRGGTWGWLTRELVPRSLAFETAVLAALAPFYHPEAFAPRRDA